MYTFKKYLYPPQLNYKQIAVTTRKGEYMELFDDGEKR